MSVSDNVALILAFGEWIIILILVGIPVTVISVMVGAYARAWFQDEIERKRQIPQRDYAKEAKLQSLRNEVLKLGRPDRAEYAAKLRRTLDTTQPVPSAEFREAYMRAFLEQFDTHYITPPTLDDVDDVAMAQSLFTSWQTAFEEYSADKILAAFEDGYRRAVSKLPPDLLVDASPSPSFTTTFEECLLQGQLLDVAKTIIDATHSQLKNGRIVGRRVDIQRPPVKWLDKTYKEPMRDTYNTMSEFALHHLLNVRIPITLTHRTRHTHIIGNSGSGKTNLIEYMIARDLADDNATVIVIDSQRQMIPKLAQCDIPFDEIAYISPRHNLGINFFDVGLKGKDIYEDEHIINSATELLEYVLGELIAAGFTDKQLVPFQFALQLMMVMPDANLRTFRKLMESKDADPYRQHFHKLSPDVREFFETQFFDPQLYKETKKEIGWRIWSLMRHPTFNRLFSATHNRFDMYEEIQKRSLILIDTDENLLKSISGTFGRIFIAQLLQVAQRRFEGTHKPVYVYIDECYAYFDDRLSHMLETARKANIGLILAHQHLGHKNIEKVLPALKNSTTTKFCGMVDPDVARAMAPQLHTTPEHIRTLPPYHFALTMGDRQVYTVSAPLDMVGKVQKRTDDLKAEMERRYGYTPPEPEPDPLDDIEEEDEEIVPSGKL